MQTLVMSIIPLIAENNLVPSICPYFLFSALETGSKLIESIVWSYPLGAFRAVLERLLFEWYPCPVFAVYLRFEQVFEAWAVNKLNYTENAESAILSSYIELYWDI